MAGGAGTKRPRAAGGKAADPKIGKEGLTPLADGATTFFVKRPFASSEASRIFLALKAGSVDSRWVQQDLVVTGKTVRAPRGGRAPRCSRGPLTRVATARALSRSRSRAWCATKARAPRRS